MGWAVGLLLSVYALLSPIAAGAQATGGEGDPSFRMAYDAALKCFAANGHSRGRQSRAGDTTAAARHEGSSRKAHELAARAGNRLGYSVPQMEQDFEAAWERELPRMIRDPAYFRQAVADCRALGLM